MMSRKARAFLHGGGAAMSGCCGGSSRKNVAAFVVMLLLLGTGVAYWLREVTKPLPVEMVEVLVASSDLTTGTTFTEENVVRYTTTKLIPKDELPDNILTSKDQLIGKRLTRATYASEFFNVAHVNQKTTTMFEAGKDIMSLPMLTKTLEEARVGPGSRVDILASFGEGEKRQVFTLLADLAVLSIGGGCDLAMPDQPPPERLAVSFAVSEPEMKLIAQANLANCNIELVVRHPASAKPDWKYDATLARVQALLKQQESQTEWAVAPPPRAVGER
jgi:Flp pilus assembly protein CpaB